jgi:hypothetical protein
MAYDDIAFYSFQLDIARALKELKNSHNIGSWNSGIDIP